MATIPQKELRNDVGGVLRRAEAGERLVITVAGRPVAELTPLRRRAWVRAADLEPLWALPADADGLDDARRLGGGHVDPFA